MITLLAVISFILALLSYLFGAVAIVRGPVAPSIISRFFWLLLSITNLFSYLNLGAGSGIYLALSNAIGSAVTFLLALRFGHIEFKKSDILSILGASMALGCYLIFTLKWLALAAGLMTHFISGIPTYKKTWKAPFSEDLAFWALFAVASACSLFGVLLQAENIIYPMYFLLFDAGMAVLIVLRRYSCSTSKTQIPLA